MTSLFVCPLCGAALTRDERAYRCQPQALEGPRR